MAVVSAAGDAPGSSPPPLISLALLRRETGDDEIFNLGVDELSRRVYAGVLLKSNEEQNKDQENAYTYKYWVHKEDNRNCWMVLAKGLQITHGDNSRYWSWKEEEEPCYHQEPRKVQVAELENVCWLEITGKCTTLMLSPSTTYEVAISVKMRSQSYGWKVPVNLGLTLPDGSKLARVARLNLLVKEKWVEIDIGKFETVPETVGNASFSLTQTDGHWKSGLCVKGVVSSQQDNNRIQIRSQYDA